jgi:tetratricopeptide (TPR) repeat protein
MTRARLYTLVDSFESDMRSLLLRYILDHLEEEEALGPSYERAAERRHADASDDELSLIEYLDMREAYDIINRHREALPVELAREVRHGTPRMDTLVPIRNRVMHGRPLRPGDAESAVSACQEFKSRFWASLNETMSHLQGDPSWEPAFNNASPKKHSDRVLNNLPISDYDETGLVGRSSDCQKIIRYLLKRRESMITITGEGGIGKTAVALDIAYSLLDDPESPYECILWTSLKTERLTTNGVVEIRDAVRDITGATQRMGSVLSDDFKGGVAELAEALEDIETLLIIDNLETVSGHEIVSLYETLPESVTYLTTSRIGVGQIERRLPLSPLQLKDAETLFRAFARTRGGNAEFLARLKQETVHEIVKRLRLSPLAIRWYILSVESGNEPHPTLTDQDALIEFCVRSVYDALSATPRYILAALYAVNRSATFDEIALLTETPIDELRKAVVQELLSGSLVMLKPDPDDELISRVQLTDAAQHYLRNIAPPNKSQISKILSREQVFRRAQEQRRVDENKRALAPNVVRVRSASDEPTAHLLRLALAQSRAGSLQRALEFIDRARALNPEFWEVDRVEAFIRSQNDQVDQATSLYRTAMRRASVDETPIVAFYFAGHLAGRGRDAEGALPLAIKAHEKFSNADTAQLLGKIHLWSRNYEESQIHLEWALERLPSRGKGRLRLITLTALVESWRRWADSLLDDERHPGESCLKAAAGFSLGIKEIDSGAWDKKLAESTLECAKSFLRAVTEAHVLPARFQRDTIRLLHGVKRNSALFEKCAAWRHFPGRVGRLRRTANIPEDVVELCQDLVNLSEPGQFNSSTASPVGIISGWCGTFGFISHPEYPNGVFFPASVVTDLNGAPGDSFDLKGQQVRFEVDDHGKGDRPRAYVVSLVGGHASEVGSEVFST